MDTNFTYNVLCFSLSSGNSIVLIASNYDQPSRDRRWKMACGYNKAVKQCAWTAYNNDWDKPLSFECPYSGFITGKSFK